MQINNVAVIFDHLSCKARIYLKTRRGDKQGTIDKDGNFKEYEEFSAFSPDGYLAEIPNEFLQQLSNELAKHGYVPESRNYKNELQLMSDHLSDVRKLLFHKEGLNDGNNSGNKN